MVLVRPDERKTWPYHCSLRLFTVVRRSSCGPVASWILARTSSLVIDAFSQDWEKIASYCSPPLNLIPKVLKRLELTKADCVLVVNKTSETIWSAFVPSSQGGSHDPPNIGRASSSAKQDSTLCLQFLRQTRQTNGVLPESPNKILSAWRSGAQSATTSTSNSGYFSVMDGINPLLQSTKKLLIFPTELYQNGTGYSSLNLARSAVATLSLTDQPSVGAHPLVCKFMPFSIVDQHCQCTWHWMQT